MASRQAVVVGAGIGGAAAALALRRQGWGVTLLERASSARELGFALLMAPNAVRALRALGVADAVLTQSVASGLVEMRRPDGRVLRRMDGGRLREVLGEDTVCVLRPVVLGALLEALGKDVLKLGVRARSYVREGGAVVVTADDGSRHSGDIVVGADGIRSTIRAQLLGDSPLRYAGFVAWRGVARGVARQLGALTGAQYLGRAREAGLALAAPDHVYWFLATPMPPGALDPSDARAGLDQALEPFHEPFRAVVDATPAEALRRDEIWDRDPVSAWGDGPVTLLGDAAHPMPPNAGQGAAQALEDAVMLGHCLGGLEDPVAALRRYERARMQRTAAIVKLSRDNARMFLVQSRAAVILRDLAIQALPERFIVSRLAAISKADLAPDLRE